MDEIVATPSAEVGSIGIFAMHQDISRAADQAGVTTTLVSAGKYKVEGNEFEPLSDEARDQIQSQVDAFYRMFVSDVAKGRNVSTSVVGESYGQGRTMLAKEAHAAGMVDRIATLEETVKRLQPRGRLAARSAAEHTHELVAHDGAGEWFVPEEVVGSHGVSEVVLVDPSPAPIEPAAPAASKESRDAFIAAQRRGRNRK
jgi:ClpP class serine protease